MHEEDQYLAVLKKVLIDGHQRIDRTSTGTLSLFAPHPFKFDLSQSFPLFTTKKVFFRGIVEELLFFIRGNTDSRLLAAKNVHIWDLNTSPDFLASVGLSHYTPGLMGPMYGFQWRFWGSSYDHETGLPIVCDSTVDQLKHVLDLITHDPFSRRIVMSCWNVSDLAKGCLHPCHILVQFYVHNQTLHCHVYQRSIDIMAGLPFNVASYALLVSIIAHVTHLSPGTLTYSFGDLHLYLNHIDAAKIQIERTPTPFPTVKIVKPFVHTHTHTVSDMIKFCESLCFDDFVLENYHPAEKIAIPFNA